MSLRSPSSPHFLACALGACLAADAAALPRPEGLVAAFGLELGVFEAPELGALRESAPPAAQMPAPEWRKSLDRSELFNHWFAAFDGARSLTPFDLARERYFNYCWTISDTRPGDHLTTGFRIKGGSFRDQEESLPAWRFEGGELVSDADVPHQSIKLVPQPGVARFASDGGLLIKSRRGDEVFMSYCDAYNSSGGLPQQSLAAIYAEARFFGRHDAATPRRWLECNKRGGDWGHDFATDARGRIVTDLGRCGWKGDRLVCRGFAEEDEESVEFDVKITIRNNLVLRYRDLRPSNHWPQDGYGWCELSQ